MTDAVVGCRTQSSGAMVVRKEGGTVTLGGKNEKRSRVADAARKWGMAVLIALVVAGSIGFCLLRQPVASGEQPRGGVLTPPTTHASSSNPRQSHLGLG